MDYTSRMVALLRELRRERNGAVADSMRYYGAPYGLNYGVSLPTLRRIARAEAPDHAFAEIDSEGVPAAECTRPQSRGRREVAHPALLPGVLTEFRLHQSPRLHGPMFKLRLQRLRAFQPFGTTIPISHSDPPDCFILTDILFKLALQNRPGKFFSPFLHIFALTF